MGVRLKPCIQLWPPFAARRIRIWISIEGIRRGLPYLPYPFFNDFKVIFNVLPYGRLTDLGDTNPRVINGNIIYNKGNSGKKAKSTIQHGTT